MEKAAVTGADAGFRREAMQACCRAALLALCVAGPAAGWASDPGQASAEVLMAEARGDKPAMKVEVRSSALPRLDSHDTGFQAPRVDLSLTPASSSGLGAVLGISGFTSSAIPLGLHSQRPSVDFGLRWSQKQVDVTAWRRMSTPDDAYSLIQARQPVYGARFEMKLAQAGSSNNFRIDRGLLGLQLESGARISIRRKNGGPMIYYRTSF